ncbi:MAG: nucleotidyltransferase domain-containing protein [Spirochaetia bacterium]|nr:nucleotidyltransferase domain-containing protein [Spirochaetia bacterium]
MQINTFGISRPLTNENIEVILKNIMQYISGRADKVFIFGSVARKKFNPDSDIDLVIVKETSEKFVRRAFEFEELFKFYPRLDIIVYTAREFADQLKKNTSFWDEFRRDAVQLI